MCPSCGTFFPSFPSFFSVKHFRHILFLFFRFIYHGRYLLLSKKEEHFNLLRALFIVVVFVSMCVWVMNVILCMSTLNHCFPLSLAFLLPHMRYCLYRPFLRESVWVLCWYCHCPRRVLTSLTARLSLPEGKSLTTLRISWA